jgi:hypothetical protein
MAIIYWMVKCAGAGGIVALTELLNLPPPKPSFNKDPKIGPTMNATHAPMSLKANTKPDDFMPSRLSYVLNNKIYT